MLYTYAGVITPQVKEREKILSPFLSGHQVHASRKEDLAGQLEF